MNPWRSAPCLESHGFISRGSRDHERYRESHGFIIRGGRDHERWITHFSLSGWSNQCLTAFKK